MMNVFARTLLYIPLLSQWVISKARQQAQKHLIVTVWIDDRTTWYGLGCRFRKATIEYGKTKDGQNRYKQGVGIIGNPQIGYNECVKIARDLYLLIAKPAPQIHPDNVITQGGGR